MSSSTFPVVESIGSSCTDLAALLDDGAHDLARLRLPTPGDNPSDSLLSADVEVPPLPGRTPPAPTPRAEIGRALPTLAYDARVETDAIEAAPEPQPVGFKACTG